MTSSPLKKLAADSNVLLSALIGKAALKIFTHLDLEIVTTEFNVDEIKEYIPHMALKYHLDKIELILQLNMLPIQRRSYDEYVGKMEEARAFVGDPDDLHLAALSLKEKIPIWSNDKDFGSFPTGVYSAAQLLKRLGL